MRTKTSSYATVNHDSVTSSHRALREQINDALARSQICRRNIASCMPSGHSIGTPEYQLIKGRFFTMCVGSAAISLMLLSTLWLAFFDSPPLSGVPFWMVALFAANMVLVIVAATAILVLIDLFRMRTGIVSYTQKGLQKVQASLRELEAKSQRACASTDAMMAIYDMMQCWDIFFRSHQLVVDINSKIVAPYEWRIEVVYAGQSCLVTGQYNCNKTSYANFIEFCEAICSWNHIPDEEVAAFLETVPGANSLMSESVPM